MSKDIWHTTDKNPEEDRLIVVKSKRTGEYLVGSEFEFVLDYFTKWAYFDDLLALETKLERTRKALELAITGLKNCKTRDHIGAICRTPEYVDKVLEQITALEQKD